MTGRTEDHSTAEQFLKNHGWKRGKTGTTRESWFLPSLAAPHVSIFWNREGRPCMTYDKDTDKTGRGLRMVWEGKKLENYSYGIEQLRADNPEDNPDADGPSLDRLESWVRMTCATMRDW